ncbi:hypothetical protein DL96DRAFT_1551134 [Flagelloscypha sp. PMI_526]|nr:hypothetical protein DL96DRAFT_1551134 [Flagelloscypha sp. PMI_526]
MVALLELGCMYFSQMNRTEKTLLYPVGKDLSELKGLWISVSLQPSTLLCPWSTTYKGIPNLQDIVLLYWLGLYEERPHLVAQPLCDWLFRDALCIRGSRHGASNFEEDSNALSYPSDQASPENSALELDERVTQKSDSSSIPAPMPPSAHELAPEAIEDSKQESIPSSSGLMLSGTNNRRSLPLPKLFSFSERGFAGGKSGHVDPSYAPHFVPRNSSVSKQHINSQIPNDNTCCICFTSNAPGWTREHLTNRLLCITCAARRGVSRGLGSSSKAIAPGHPSQTNPIHHISESLNSHACSSCGTRSAEGWKRDHEGIIRCYPCSQYLWNSRLIIPSISQEFVPPTAESSSGRSCSACGAQQSPLWRRGGEGEVLCNACGRNLRANGHPRLPIQPGRARNRQVLRPDDKKKLDQEVRLARTIGPNELSRSSAYFPSSSEFYDKPAISEGHESGSFSRGSSERSHGTSELEIPQFIAVTPLDRPQGHH